MVRAGFRHAGCDGTNADFRDEFDRNLRCRIDVFKIVNQLCQIFDRIDVVMRRWRDQAHALRRVADLCNHRIDLMAGQLAAFAGLGTLRHLDLHHIGIDEIFGGYTKAARGDLLDGRAHRIAIGHWLVAIRLFAAFARIGLAADAVHRNRKCRMGFARNRAVGHRTRCEALDDSGCTLNFIKRHGFAAIFFRALDMEETANGE